MADVNKNDLETSLTIDEAFSEVENNRMKSHGTIKKMTMDGIEIKPLDEKDFVQNKDFGKIKTIKIHFEISADEWTRASRYITNYRMRHEYAKQAFIELINRKEGRDKKLQAEKMVRDSKYIQDMIDKGLIKLSEVRC